MITHSLICPHRILPPKVFDDAKQKWSAANVTGQGDGERRRRRYHGGGRGGGGRGDGGGDGGGMAE